MRIFTAEQLEDVPEGAIVTFPIMNGTQRMTWRDGKLHGDLHINRIPQDPQWVIDHYGPLTVLSYSE